MTPQRVLERLLETEVVLIGGFAAVYHGAHHVTVDIDLCYRPSDTNRRRLVDALAPLRPYLRGADPGLPFFWDARALTGTPLLTLATSAGAVDLLPDVLGVGDFDAVWSRSQSATLFEIPVRVLDLDALIDAKRAVGRPKDMLLVPDLELLLARKRAG